MILQTSGNSRATPQILPFVTLTFVAYLAIGAPLAILPAYAHVHLGLGAIWSGFLISLQYIATFANRPRAGAMSDTIGPKRTVLWGLLACTLGSLCLALGACFEHDLAVSLTLFVISRLAMGTGESLCATGATMWAIGRVGTEKTAQIISLNGIATYAALAIGAPMGVFLEGHWGLVSVGALLCISSSAGFVLAFRMPKSDALEVTKNPAPKISKIIWKVMPYGLALATGGLGFGVVTTFVALYFTQRNWPNAALSLTIFGMSFVCVRLLFSDMITRYGGFLICRISFMVEGLGLLMLAFAQDAEIARLGTGLIGAGFALVFPSLAVELVKKFPKSVHGSVLGVYNAFVDLSLFLTGPIAGTVIDHFGYAMNFLATSVMIILALFGVRQLQRSSSIQKA